MALFALTLWCWAGGPGDAEIIGYWLKAAGSTSPTAKYEALAQGLMAIDRGVYSRGRADAIGRLYGSLLVQDVPSVTKHQVCRTLSRMDGLDESVDAVLQYAERYKAVAVANTQIEGALVVMGPQSAFRSGPFALEVDEERVADHLIAALWRKKSGGRSHFSGGFVRFTPVSGATSRGFLR